jgi:hypothetical protein
MGSRWGDDDDKDFELPTWAAVVLIVLLIGLATWAVLAA